MQFKSDERVDMCAVGERRAGEDCALRTLVRVRLQVKQNKVLPLMRRVQEALQRDTIDVLFHKRILPIRVPKRSDSATATASCDISKFVSSSLIPPPCIPASIDERAAYIIIFISKTTAQCTASS